MTTTRAIKEIELIQMLSDESVMDIYLTESRQDAIWDIIDRADGSIIEILIGAGYSDSEVNEFIRFNNLSK